MRFVNYVGVELEGAWDGDPSDGTPVSLKGEKMGSLIGVDVSVSGFDKPHFGEAASPPLPLQELLEWMGKHYPTAVNESCGFHVHVSFKNILSYSRLMEDAFWTFFLAEATKFGKGMKWGAKHPFWARLNGKNRFSMDRFNPEAQVTQKTKVDSRRTHLNFCFAQHGTLECRLFPAFADPQEATRAVEWLTSTYESYLGALPKESRKTLLLTEDDMRGKRKLPPLPTR